MKQNEICVTYGTDVRRMTRDIIERIDLAEMIGDQNKTIGLKPNLVVPAPASSGATTHPEMLEVVIEYLQDHGFHNITIMEGSWVGSATTDAFSRCGFYDLAKRYHVEITDLKGEETVVKESAGLRIEVTKKALEVGFLINFPVVKGHCQTTMTCALKNLKGIISDREKRRFHSLGLHKPIAALAAIRRPDLNLVDGICGDLDFEEGGNPVVMNRIFACLDPVLTDAYACSIMGYDVKEVPYITLAEQLGVGSADLGQMVLTEIGSPVAAATPKVTRRIEKLAKYIEAKDACSACYGSLVHALARLDDRGLLGRLPREKIRIGQGWRGVEGEEIGIGACTKGCKASLAGCPPTGLEILDFLEEQLSRR